MDLSTLRGIHISRPSALRLLLAALLSVVTLVLYVAIGRYEIVGDERLANASLSAGLDGWSQRGEVALSGGVLAIRNEGPGGSAGLQQVLPGSDRPLYLSVSGEVRSEDVRRGRSAWQSARLILVARGADGNWRFNLPHEVMRLAGTHGWDTYTRTLRLPAAEAYLFSAQLVQATGRIEVRNLSVREARIRPGFDSAAFVLMAVWLASGMWIILPLFSRARTEPWSAAALVVTLLIAVGTLATGDVRSGVREWLAARIDVPTQVRATPPAAPAAGGAGVLVVDGPNLFWQMLDKSGHFTAYAVLAVVLVGAALRRVPGRVPAGALAGLFAYGAVTEVLQLMSQDRGAAVSDVGINWAGALTGLCLLWLARRALRARGPRAGADAPPPVPPR